MTWFFIQVTLFIFMLAALFYVLISRLKTVVIFATSETYPHLSHSWLSWLEHLVQCRQSESARSRIHRRTWPVNIKHAKLHALFTLHRHIAFMSICYLFKFFLHSFGYFIFLLKSGIQLQFWYICPYDWTSVVNIRQWLYNIFDNQQKYIEWKSKK